MKTVKKSPASKENTLTSATQTTMKLQDEIVAEFTASIANLKKTVERLQSELVITKNVNDILTNEVDDLQQYQQRQCIVIDGLETTPNKKISQVTQKAENAFAQHIKLDPDEVVNQINKCHRIVLHKNDGTHLTKVRFKSYSFREKAYVNRKKCTNRNIKIKLSLTRKRRKTLTYAYKISDKFPNVDFFYADIHSNLKLRLNETVNNKIVYPFRDKQELLNLFKKFKWNIDGLELEEEFNGSIY